MRFSISLLVAISIFSFAACHSDDDDDDDNVPAKAEEAPVSSPAAPQQSEMIEVETGGGGGRQSIVVANVDGKSIFEGDIEIPNRPAGAAVFGNRWPNKRVAYVLSASLPHPERITDAIAHWEANTALRFVPRTTQSDYIRFTPGRGCSAVVGRVGGLQDVTLQTGEHIKSIVGADFDPSTARAHYWFKDGLHSVGRSWNLDETAPPSSFTAATGKTAADIRDTAFASNGDVYTWYADGTVSIGSPANLGSKGSGYAYTLPKGKTPASIVGVAFLANNHARAWYADGTTSEGTPYNLAAYAAPVSFSVPSGESVAEVLAVGISGSNVYAWYPDAKASGGTITSLAATYAPYAVTMPGHCGVPQVIHEIGHAVGLQHEQTRSDRDQYITIQYANISDGTAYNFNKHDSASGDYHAYDYFSIMHYDSYAFSKNGYATILRKDGGLIADQSVLSTGDIRTIGSMYP